MTSKNCTQCNTIKQLSDFGKNPSCKDGRYGACKSCRSEDSKIYSRTKPGLIANIYKNQRGNSTRRGSQMPDYSLNELRLWAFSEPLFHNLYDLWVSSGYNIMMRPSFDRIDDYRPYTLNNIQLMTWKENKEKSNYDIKNGINNKMSTSVIQMTMDGEFISEHHSMRSAGRLTGVCNQSISLCCSGRYRSTKNYRWMRSLGVPIYNNAKGDKL